MNTDIQTYLAEVRAREPKSQQTIKRSVELWEMKQAQRRERSPELGEIAPDGFRYADGPKPRKTFTQVQPKDPQ